MRKITEIIVHCSATEEDKDYTVDDIRQSHKQRGFKDIGYHYVIYRDGSVHSGRPIKQTGAHCIGHNAHSIGICYIGGLEAHTKTPKDTRTQEQKESMHKLIAELCKRFPTAKIMGHRDTSPDTNNNGKIDRWEWLKDCPCFDAINEYKDL